MKKKPTRQSIPEFKAKYHPNLDLKSIPHPEVPVKEQRQRIYKYFIKDMKREMRDKEWGTFFYKGPLIHYWPHSSEELRLQDQFDKAIIGHDDKEHSITTLKHFLNWFGKVYSPGPKKYFPDSRDSETEDEENNSINAYGEDKTEIKDKVLDAKKFSDIFLKYGIGFNDKVPLFYLIAIAIYEEILPDLLNTKWLLPDIGGVPPILKFKKRMSLWENIYIAYFASGLKGYRPPFRIIQPPKQNKKFRAMESFLKEKPQYYLKKLSWHYGQKYLKELNLPYSIEDEITGDLVTGNLLEDLPNHPGIYIENRNAWDLYRKIMGEQGPLDRVQKPGFVHFLVDILSAFNDRKKYDLASLFLRGYLGIKDITANQIKAHLKQRKKAHQEQMT